MIVTSEKKTEIYEEFHPKVLRYLISKTNNAMLAEDIAADVFLKVYEKLDGYDEGKASLSTWIYTITRNMLIDYYRTRRVFSEIPEEYPEESSVEEAVESAESLENLADALEKLEGRERDIIILRYYKGMRLNAIAEQMGFSYTYIKKLHQRALEKLKKLL